MMLSTERLRHRESCIVNREWLTMERFDVLTNYEPAIFVACLPAPPSFSTELSLVFPVV
jgi:hypothetical protein